MDESNILGKLVSIKKDDIAGYCSFFEKNGFLFPISTGKPYTVGIIELQIIVKQLTATLELMSTITDMSKISYEKIVRLIFYHLFAPIVMLETREGKYKYKSGRH